MARTPRSRGSGVLSTGAATTTSGGAAFFGDSGLNCFLFSNHGQNSAQPRIRGSFNGSSHNNQRGRGFFWGFGSKLFSVLESWPELRAAEDPGFFQREQPQQPARARLFLGIRV